VIGVKFLNLQGYEMGGSNPLLTPSHAKSKTFGVIFSPKYKYVKGLEITIDYFKIDEKDLIGNPASDLTMMQSVEEYGPNSPFAPFVTLGAFAGQGGKSVTAPGQLSPDPSNVYVLETLLNIASQQQHGYDINVKYTLPWQTYGRFVINTEWAILKQFFVKTGPTDSGTDYAGFDDYGTLPKTRSYTTVDWNYKAYGATLGWTNIHHIDNYSGDTMNPYNTFDFQFRINLGKLDNHLNGVSLDLGVNNFTNQKPVIDRDDFASLLFDASTYSFFGWMYFADLRIKF